MPRQACWLVSGKVSVSAIGKFRCPVALLSMATCMTQNFRVHYPVCDLPRMNRGACREPIFKADWGSSGVPGTWLVTIITNSRDCTGTGTFTVDVLRTHQESNCG
jgi:hypothetical protein